MRRAALKILGMNLFRASGWPRLMPVSVAYSVTHKCNSRCRTCGLGSARGASNSEMDTGEWLRVFESLGQSPVWITVTGGEPFLRDDFMELSRGMVEQAHPRFMTVATNGFFTGKAASALPKLAKEFPDTRFIANISLDGIGGAHDKLRGLPGGFDAAIDTFHALKQKQPKNLHVGFHTVVSSFNADSVKYLIVYAKAFKPDAHVFEPAQPREELRIRNKDVAPSPEKFRELVPALTSAMSGKSRGAPTRRMRYAVRERYYTFAAEAMEKKRQPVPCLAGHASAQVSPSGDVWACCVKARSMGNLRDADFDFESVWKGKEAAAIRKPIAAGECWCTMSNAMSTSLMFNPGEMTSIVTGYFSGYRGRKKEKN